MTDFTEHVKEIDNAVAVKNPKMLKKLLTDSNFTIISVSPFNDPRKIHNSVAKVRVDRYDGSDVTVPDSERYFTRRIPFNRLPLRDALREAGFVTDELGRYKVGVSVATLEAFVAGVRSKVHFEEGELIFRPSNNNSAMLRAKTQSLGYTGQVIVTGEGDVEPIKEITKITVNGPDEVFDYNVPTAFTFECYDQNNVRMAPPSIPNFFGMPAGYIDATNSGEWALGKFAVQFHSPSGNDVPFTMNVEIGDVIGTHPLTLIEDLPLPVFTSIEIQGPNEIRSYGGDAFTEYTIICRDQNGLSMPIPSEPGLTFFPTDRHENLDISQISTEGKFQLAWKAPVDGDQVVKITANIQGIEGSIDVTLFEVAADDDWVNNTHSFVDSYLAADIAGDIVIDEFSPFETAYLILVPKNITKPTRGKLFATLTVGEMSESDFIDEILFTPEMTKVPFPFPIGNRPEILQLIGFSIDNSDSTVKHATNKWPFKPAKAITRMDLTGPNHITEFGPAQTYNIACYDEDNKRVYPYYEVSFGKPDTFVSIGMVDERTGNFDVVYRQPTADHQDLLTVKALGSDQFANMAVTVSASGEGPAVDWGRITGAVGIPPGDQTNWEYSWETFDVNDSPVTPKEVTWSSSDPTAYDVIDESEFQSGKWKLRFKPNYNEGTTVLTLRVIADGVEFTHEVNIRPVAFPWFDATDTFKSEVWKTGGEVPEIAVERSGTYTLKSEVTKLKEVSRADLYVLGSNGTAKFIKEVRLTAVGSKFEHEFTVTPDIVRNDKVQFSLKDGDTTFETILVQIDVSDPPN